MVKFSIIIPVKSINDFIRETVYYIQALKTKEWELFIIPNNMEKNEWQEDERIYIIDSGRVGPAHKRDLGAQKASGDILVFLDDDSYPKSNFLEVASRHFKDSEVIALGGPGITPPSDSFWQRVSGAVFLSKFTGGSPERYVSLGVTREIDDWPSVNLMVRKDAFLSVGGFDSKYWPGEDTLLCLKLKKTGKKLIYEPNMIVWHHRRAGLLRHLKQIGAYGLHRGFFAKKYPDTSLRVKYFLPSAFALFFVISLFYLVLPSIAQIVTILGWLVYIITLLLAGIKILRYEKASVAIVSLIFVLPTHFYYGLNFIYGYLFKQKLVSVLR
jgi:GT2 family glycosyltransferase